MQDAVVGAILRERASSGELGVLVDQAIRLAEQGVVAQEAALGATGKSIGRPTSSPPDSLRPPAAGVARPASSSPISSGPSLDASTGATSLDESSSTPTQRIDHHSYPHSFQNPPIPQGPYRPGPVPRPPSSNSPYPPPQFQSHPSYLPMQPQFDPYQYHQNFYHQLQDPRTSPLPPLQAAPPPPQSAGPPPPPISSPQYGGYQPFPFPAPQQQHQQPEPQFNQTSPYYPYHPQILSHNQPQRDDPEQDAGDVVFGSDGSPAMSHLSLQNQPYSGPPPNLPMGHHNLQPGPSSVYASYDLSHLPPPPPQFQPYQQSQLSYSQPPAPFSPYSDYSSHPSSPHSRWSSTGSFATFPGPAHPNQSPNPYSNSPYRPVNFYADPNPQYPGQNVGYNALLHSAPPPLPYEPPHEPTPARGHLAQVNFREAVQGGNVGGRGGEGAGKRSQQGGPRSTLPRPPMHSPHALWVGNVPSDATHVELWRFFALRPVPASSKLYAGKEDEHPGIDLHSTGVESIHLIARSNCAFVNYASDLHLQHSIAVSHNVSLRPFDMRCKELVCRVRKSADDKKSGVGAQRLGGMHHAYVNSKKVEAKENDSPTSPPAKNSSGASSGGGRSLSTASASTSSSFLKTHFPKRYFVLKSHDEADLKLSVATGLWATQSHNEPVLDQAFRTSRDGVFLFFSANNSGEFFGYARMASAITDSAERTKSWSNRTSAPDSSGSTRPPAIPENEEATEYPARPNMLFTESEGRLADKSPMPLTPAGSKLTTPTTTASGNQRVGSAPASMNPGREANLSAGGHAVAAKLHMPKVEGRHGGSLDPKVLATVRNLPTEPEYHQLLLDQQTAGAAKAVAELTDDGVWRRDTLPTAEERNARLEKVADPTAGGDSSASPAGWGRPFKVEWLKVGPLPFSQTKNIRNSFNSSREVKISRDGTEIEPVAGEQLIAEFWRGDPAGPPGATSPPAGMQASGLVRSA